MRSHSEERTELPALLTGDGQPAGTDAYLSVSGVRKEFGGTAAIAEVDFAAAKGSFVAIVGPSGCGKSTLLACAGGVERPTQGRVTVGGIEVSGPSRRLGYVFQEDSLLPWRTALGNVRFALEGTGLRKADQIAKARDMLRLVGLQDFEDHYPSQLSGGMKQRVAIARVLAAEPDVLLMDEPFSALDQQTRLLLGEQILRIWEATKQTILFVTHDIQEAVLLSSEVLVLSARPARLLTRIPVPFAHPRDAQLAATPEFAELTSDIWSVLGGEAKLAFQRDEAVGGRP